MHPYRIDQIIQSKTASKKIIRADQALLRLQKCRIRKDFDLRIAPSVLYDLNLLLNDRSDL